MFDRDESREGGAFFPVGAGPNVDFELLAFRQEHPVVPRAVEGVGEVTFVAVRPLGRFELSERNMGFFGFTDEPENDEAIRTAFKDALEGGAFE